MNPIYIRSFKSFIAPVLWLLIFGIANAAGKTTWGTSGHPSNGLIMYLYALLSAPLFGIAGCAYTYFDKTQDLYPIKQVALVFNIILISVGGFFWISWFH